MEGISTQLVTTRWGILDISSSVKNQMENGIAWVSNQSQLHTKEAESS